MNSVTGKEAIVARILYRSVGDSPKPLHKPLKVSYQIFYIIIHNDNIPLLFLNKLFFIEFLHRQVLRENSKPKILESRPYLY